jgi:hypothetical protein
MLLSIVVENLAFSVVDSIILNFGGFNSLF